MSKRQPDPPMVPHKKPFHSLEQEMEDLQNNKFLCPHCHKEHVRYLVMSTGELLLPKDFVEALKTTGVGQNLLQMTIVRKGLDICRSYDRELRICVLMDLDAEKKLPLGLCEAILTGSILTVEKE